MVKKSKRQHPRIHYEGQVDLIFADRQMSGCLTKNLCLSGVWISGCLDCLEGEQCDIAFHNAGLAGGRALMIKGQVSRIDRDGIAIALIFKDMNMRTYTNLQTMMTNYSENTFEEADEFLDRLQEEES